MKYHPTPYLAGVLVALAAAAGPIRSQTLAEYHAIADANNPELEAARLHWEAARATAAQSDRLPNPQLRYGYFGEAVETRVGPQRWKAGVSQELPWYGTRQLVASTADERARVAGERYAEQRRALHYEVTRWYHEYAYLASAIKVNRETISLIQRFEEIATTRLKTGGSLGEVIKTQIERSQLQDQLRSLLERREPLAAQFNVLLNRAPDTPVPWPAAAEPAATPRLEPDVSRALLEDNPTVRKLHYQAVHARVNRELVRKRQRPTVVLGMEYIDTGRAATALDDSGKDPWVASIAVDLPLWQANDRAEVAAAEYQRQAAERLLEEQTNRLESELRMAVYACNDADRRLSLYDETLIPQAHESLNVTEEAYRSGTQDILDLIDAERVLLRFALDRERALADREIARGAITQLTGEENR